MALPETRAKAYPRPSRVPFAERFYDALRGTLDIAGPVCVPLGHAGGLWCMEQALSSLASGRCQACLVGGADSYMARETLEWLDNLDQLHSETTTWGFCPGEGAGFCLLATEEFASARGLPVDVEVLAAASAVEPNRIKTETVCLGQGLTAAFRTTLSAVPSGIRFTHTISDMNGEPYRANEYGFAVLRSAARFSDDADFQTPADCWGDVGAASAPLFAVLATFAARKNRPRTVRVSVRKLRRRPAHSRSALHGVEPTSAMPTHIVVNNLGLTYKSTIGLSTATLPDVCKTPSPGGPVPIPYPNVADQGSLANGTTTVKAKGKMIAIKGSEYSRSSGDEPGTAGGVTSSTFKKETSWITYSFDVKMNGKNACRHTDKKPHNHKNTWISPATWTRSTGKDARR